MKKIKLTKEEKNLLKQYERGEWKSSATKAELRKYIIIAKNTIQKYPRFSIRISSHDLDILRKKASEEGLPYQTFVSSVLHKYVTGRLVA